MELIKTLFLRLKKKALPRHPEEQPKPSKETTQAPAYTEEEARKVKERLQGLGYID